MTTQPTLDTPSPASDHEDLDHVCCCCDADVALCGTDVGHIEFYDDDTDDTDDEEMCVVCLDLEQTTFCPLGGTCARKERAA